MNPARRGASSSDIGQSYPRRSVACECHIVERIDQIGATDPDDTITVQELLFGLHALILVYFQKEEDIQLPLLDEQPPEYVADLMQRMHAAHAGAHEHA